MGKVKFSDIFSVEYVDIIEKYKDRIQALFSTYDVMIFMARKAICFYKAMVANGEIIPNDKCVVLSSRVLSYNVISGFKGKKVAVLDDVVVRGKSLSYSKDIFEKNDISVDIHFVACEREFVESVNFKEYIKSPYKYLSDINIYQLSSYITEYIEASGIPYNVDQPIYSIYFEDKEEYEKKFLNNNYVSDITDGLQKKHGIKNMLIHFDSSELKSIFGNEFEFDNCYLKIRFLHYTDASELVAIPFVLLPEMSYELLDKVFTMLFCDVFNKYIYNYNKREEYENKLKVLQYVLSDALFINYSKKVGFQSVEKDLKNEQMQYGKILFDYSVGTEMNNALSKVFYCNQTYGFENYFVFDSFLSDTYDYIFNSQIPTEQFLDAKGKEQEQRIITFSGLVSYIKKLENIFEKYAISSIIDILIDKGILIPSIVHRANNSIIRGYKCGEIFNLTRKGIDLFAYMLDKYVELNEGRLLDKVEVEKLCVLFFKNVAYRNKLFSASKTFDDDCFSICYSKFGPRVSNCDKKYKVESRSALVTVLDERGKLYLEKEKYKISVQSAPTDKKWTIIAENFALSYFHLSKCFGEKGKRYGCVHTYNDFLTLLAIGPDGKNKMLSLMAELNLLLRIEMKDSLSDIVKEMDYYSPKRYDTDRQLYQGIMDGINSGLWKYSCFCDSDLMDSLFCIAGKEQSDVRFIKEDYLTNVDENDENPTYISLIDKCGYLLYEIAYLFNYAQKKFTNVEINRIFSKSVFYNKKFESMRHAIKKKCEVCSQQEIINDFIILKKRALALVNECDLCIEDAALNTIEICDAVLGLFHPDLQFKNLGIEINLHSFNETDLIRKCIFFRYDKDNSFEIQLSELIQRYSILGTKALLLFIDIENTYEGIFQSSHTATGDYFKELIRKLIVKSNNVHEMSADKVAICTRKMLDTKKDVEFKEYYLKYDSYGEVHDGYKFYQYVLLKKEDNNMKKCNGGSITNFNGPITINGGKIGAIGTVDTVNQNTNMENELEGFYKDISDIDTEVWCDNSRMVELVEDIKMEASNKNEEGVLTKLKNLAISVGSGVFAKLASTVIIDVMKAKGYYPF